MEPAGTRQRPPPAPVASAFVPGLREPARRLAGRHRAAVRSLDIPRDPREAQIARLKAANEKLKERLVSSEQAIDELTEFRTQALAQLAAQHEEIVRIREAATGTSRVSRLPAPRTTVIGSCS
ncbi:hypothetical protein GCM10009647_090830 [Streptomyces sanglieri]